MLTILLKINVDNPKLGNYRQAFDPDDLALVICHCKDEEGKYMALVEYYGMTVDVIVKGNVKKSRSEVAMGFRDQVERLFGEMLGDAWIE